MFQTVQLVCEICPPPPLKKKKNLHLAGLHFPRILLQRAQKGSHKTPALNEAISHVRLPARLSLEQTDRSNHIETLCSDRFSCHHTTCIKQLRRFTVGTKDPTMQAPHIY